MFGWFCGILLKLFRITVEGHIPNDVAKKLYLIAPHTSNFDFPLGIMVRAAYKVETNYIAKHTIFRFPFGWFFRKSGGIPVNRTVKTNFIDEVIEVYKQNERVSIGIAPEGTRSKVERFRTGFYHIARGANVPVCLVTFDWGQRKVIFGKVYHLSEDKEKEVAEIEAYYTGIKGFYRSKSFRMEDS